MKDGLVHLNLWPFYKTDPRLVSAGEFWFLREKVLFPKPEETDRFKAKQYARLVLQFDTFNLPVFWSLRDLNKMPPLSSKESILKKTPTTYELSQLRTLLVRDPLSWKFSETERELLIKCRYHYKNTSIYLPLFLSAIDWSDPEEVAEAQFMLKVWEPMAPEEALMLLDATFPDSEVRLYAVQRISEFSDDDLALYLLELVQALIYEDQHWSPLGEFLLERSLSNPQMIGHEFFWLLRSQLHIKPSFERFGLLLEQFLMLCGSFAKELEDEMLANLAAGNEAIAGLLIGDQVDVALAILLFLILHSIKVAWQRPQALGEQPHLRCVQRKLTGTRLEYLALACHDVAQIPVFEGSVDLFTDIVARDVDLDPAALVLQGGEAGFAHD
ncbi:MAG: hypothetical protein EOP04_27655, partial [Proteobacteria bacterium]